MFKFSLNIFFFFFILCRLSPPTKSSQAHFMDGALADSLVDFFVGKHSLLVKLQKSTKFALYSMVELSKVPQSILSAKQIAEKYRISEHHVSKVLQQLSRVGFVRSIRGIKGGFQLAKDPKDITMLDIIELFEPQTPPSGCILLDFEDGCLHKEACQIGNVMNEIQEQAYYTLKSISIATLIAPKKIS